MTPYFERGGVTLFCGDSRAVLAGMEAASVDACVTDPPYELSFMSKKWDGTGIAFDPSFWREVLRVLKPGAHLLAFGGARTYHRMAVAIEDAGFEIRDSIAAWMHAQGFPKSLDVSKAIDQAAGAERPIVGSKAGQPGYSLTMGKGGLYGDGIGGNGDGERECEVTAPVTDLARQWEGWGTALKPSWEPVLWAQKPLNVVPFDGVLVRYLHHALGGLLWRFASSALPAPWSLPLSLAERNEATCGSVLAAAAMNALREKYGETDTSSLPEVVLTSLSIASSWSNILDGLSDSTIMSTTSTASNMTTGLRTLNSLLAPLISPNTMPVYRCLHAGKASHVRSAENSSSGEWVNWLGTLRHSVLDDAIGPIARVVASVLANIVAECFGAPAGASSALADATPTTGQNTHDQRSNWEPIILARAPLDGTIAANVAKWGTGGINIDKCRIEVKGLRQLQEGTGKTGAIYGSGSGGRRAIGVTELGRWPANTVFTCCGDEPHAEGCPTGELDRQSGVSTTPQTVGRGAGGRNGRYRPLGAQGTLPSYGDTGTASRFFFIAKPSRAERDYGLDALPAKSGGEATDRTDGSAGLNSPRAGSGRTGGARNHHPTVKPQELLRYLITMITQPGGTVIDPFAGSGTTLIAARALGFRSIGIEQEEEYCRLAEGRLSQQVMAL